MAKHNIVKNYGIQKMVELYAENATTKRKKRNHIDYDKKNCNSDNLITLCRVCHIKTNFNRSYWINYFKELKKYE